MGDNAANTGEFVPNADGKPKDNTALRIAVPLDANANISPPPNVKLSELQDSIKIAKNRKTRKSFSESLADLTKAMTVDSNIRAKLAENDTRLTLPQFRKWLMAGHITEIYMHGSKGEPYPIRLWLAEDGFSLRYDRLHDYCGICKRPHRPAINIKCVDGMR